MVEANFDFLKNNHLLGDQYDAAHKIAQLYGIGDYRDVIVNERILLEATVKKIFDWENLDHYYPVQDGEYRNLRNDLYYLQNNVDYPLSIFNLMNEIRRMGNDAIHDPHYRPNKGAAWRSICDLNDVLVFLLNSYDDQKLNYLRPDMAFEAQENKSGKYKQRKVIHNFSHREVKSNNDNVEQAQALLKKKKHRHFSRLRKFLRR